MQIYIAEGTQQTGPFDLDTIKEGLRAGRYTPAQLAWYEGAPGWEPISSLPGMETFLAPPPPPLPIYPPMPPAYPPGAYAPAPPPFPPGAGGAPARKNPAAAIGGAVIGGIVLLLGLLRVGLAFLPHQTSSSAPHPSASTPGSTPAASSADSSSPTVPKAVPAPGTRHYATRPAGYTGDLSAHYVAFSFDYPEAWVIKENTQDCYVVVRHPMRVQSGKTVNAESFTFSYAYNKPGHPLSTTLDIAGPQLLEMIMEPVLKDSPAATRTAARAGRFGPYPSQEAFITDHVGDDKMGLYYRCAVVPQPNDTSTDGISACMVSSDTAGTRSAESLGESGGLRTIRDSFRFEP